MGDEGVSKLEKRCVSLNTKFCQNFPCLKKFSGASRGCPEALRNSSGSTKYYDSRQLIWQSWIDEYLTWEPNDYGGLNVTYLLGKYIWTPTIKTLNA